MTKVFNSNGVIQTTLMKEITLYTKLKRNRNLNKISIKTICLPFVSLKDKIWVRFL